MTGKNSKRNSQNLPSFMPQNQEALWVFLYAAH